MIEKYLTDPDTWMIKPKDDNDDILPLTKETLARYCPSEILRYLENNGAQNKALRLFRDIIETM